MNKIVRIGGIGIDLCLFRTDDEAIEAYTKWIADEEINCWIGQHTNVLEYRDEEEWVNRKISNNVKRFNIVSREDHKLIGNCDITIDDYSRNACLGILIGEKSGRDRGYGTEAIKLLVKYCFDELNMHNVWLQVNGDNKRAIRCYEKAGFKVCITEKESIWMHRHWCDTLTMQILEQEYERIAEHYLDDIVNKYIGSNKRINTKYLDKLTDNKETKFGEDLNIDIDRQDNDSRYFATRTIDFQ